MSVVRCTWRKATGEETRASMGVVYRCRIPSISDPPSKQCTQVRPSKVVLHSGCEPRRVRPSQPPVASLGAWLVTAMLKRRQAR